MHLHTPSTSSQIMYLNLSVVKLSKFWRVRSAQNIIWSMMVTSQIAESSFYSCKWLFGVHTFTVGKGCDVHAPKTRPRDEIWWYTSYRVHHNMSVASSHDDNGSDEVTTLRNGLDGVVQNTINPAIDTTAWKIRAIHESQVLLSTVLHGLTMCE